MENRVMGALLPQRKFLNVNTTFHSLCPCFPSFSQPVGFSHLQTQHHTLSFGDLHFLLNCFFWKQCILWGTQAKESRGIRKSRFQSPLLLVLLGKISDLEKLPKMENEFLCNCCLLLPPILGKILRKNKWCKKYHVYDSACVRSMHVFCVCVGMHFQSSLSSHHLK